MKKFESLFNVRSDGATHQWLIQVIGNQYRTISGLVAGKKVTSAWTTCGGKNEGRSNATSPAGQAKAEAEALFQKKLDKGYRTLKDMREKGSAPKFFKPMLAKNFEDYEEEIAESFRPDLPQSLLFSQPKLDGIRCVATKDGLFSRNGKPILSAPHIIKQLASFFDVNPAIVLDGELYTHKFADNFNKIVSIAKKTKPTAEDIAQSAKHLEYHIYDLFDRDYPLVKFSKRAKQVQFVCEKGDRKSVKWVETTQVNSTTECDQLFSQYLQDGYEGQMLRQNAPYENKRSKNLIKRKVFTDCEFLVRAVLEGVGNREGMAGSLLFKTDKGKKFTAAVMGTNEYRKQLLADPKKVIGKKATVKFFQWTPDGLPRFPVVKIIHD